MSSVIPKFSGEAEGFKEKLPYLKGEGDVLLEVIDAREGVSYENVPYVCVDFKVVESTNAMHPVDTKTTEYVGLQGKFWKKDLAFLFSGLTGNSPTAISSEVVAALIAGKDQFLVGRRMLVQCSLASYTNGSGEAKTYTKKVRTCKSPIL